MIKSFKINKLFGVYNIHIPFFDETTFFNNSISQQVQILVSENGYGKTTILNILYHLLNLDFTKLVNIDFDSVELIFTKNSEENIVLKKDLIIKRVQLIDDNLPYEFYEFEDNIKRLKYNSEEKDFDITENRRESKDILEFFLKKRISKNFYRSSNAKKVIDDYHAIIEKIGNSINNYKLLNFPTYRRIEKSIHLDKNVSRDQIPFLHFGMGDVQKGLDDVTNEIIKSSFNQFSKVSGSILTQLLGEVDAEISSSQISEKEISIILGRLGDNIKDTEKSKIINLVKTGEIFKPNHKQLLQFVFNLSSIYKEQEKYDKAIHNFVNICNKYLTNKVFIYNESEAKVSIIHKVNNRTLDLENLSSGEKQIISIFAYLYLFNIDTNNIILFFDEPELSISIEWQKDLLVDILSTGKCKFIFATTHSPFIFANDDLSKYTVDLSEFIEIIDSKQ